jgi:serine/threonine protein kinase
VYALNTVGNALLLAQCDAAFCVRAVVKLAYFALFAPALACVLVVNSRRWRAAFAEPIAALERRSGVPLDTPQRRDLNEALASVRYSPAWQWLVQASELQPLHETVGSGASGHAALFMCRGERVVVKTLPVSALLFASAESPARAALAQLKEELHRLAQMRACPQIVRVIGLHFDVDAVAGPQVGIVMEYCAGGSLATRLRASTVPEHALAWALDWARALAYMHEQRGVVHRDIKPQNVVVTADGRGKLIDLGSLRAAPARCGACNTCYHADDDESGLLGMTPAYVAPELLLRPSQAASPKCDVWAFGFLLWHLVTRKEYPTIGTPTTHESAPLRSAVCEVVVEHLHDARQVYAVDGRRLPLPPDLRADVAGLIQRCWSTEPDRRPTMSSVAAQLEGMIGGRTDPL